LIEWLVFLIAAVPILELRGAIPLALLYNPSLSPVIVFAICIIVNFLAIPIAYFILDFIVPPLRRRIKLVDKIFKWFVKRAKKHQRLSLVGLAVFGITGAYTGTLIAYILGIDRKRAAAAIAVGVIIAGIIVWALAAFGIILIRGVS
jgi:uncharacterized membrane protein